MIKLSITRLTLAVLGATPVFASIQIGPFEMPEKDYRSPRACEHALSALVKVEMAKPQSEGREVGVNDGQLTISTYADPVSSWQTFRCRGSFLNEVRGGVQPSPLPPPPPTKP